MVDGVIRKITSALPSARPQPQIIRGTIDRSRRGRTNVFTPRNQSESMQPNRTRKQISISVPRSSRKCARPMTTTRSPDDFSIFFNAAPKNRGERQITKWNNSISTMALCIEEKNSFFKFLEKGKKLWILAYIFPLLFPKIRYNDDSWSTILFWIQEMEIDELKIWMFTRFSRRNYEMFDRIVSKRFLSMEERSNGLLIF